MLNGRFSDRIHPLIMSLFTSSYPFLYTFGEAIAIPGFCLLKLNWKFPLASVSVAGASVAVSCTPGSGDLFELKICTVPF